MPFRHVEDTEPVAGEFQTAPRDYTWSNFGPVREQSRTTVGHSVYRCMSCRALAVTVRGDPPPTKCGRCKS